MAFFIFNFFYVNFLSTVFFFYFRGRLKWGSACIGDDYAIEEELISNSLMTLLYGKKQS